MPDGASRLVRRARGFAATAVRAIRTRIELLGVEIQEEVARFVRHLLIALAALQLLVCGLMLAIAWIVLVLPVELRGLVLGIIALLIVLAGAGALAWLRLQGARRRPFLHATVAILRDDEEALDKTA